MQIAILGGGAAGFFAAIAAAESCPAKTIARIVLFERGNDVLQKVRISGGGRCNVTHACFEARELVKNYPRGSRELLAPFLRFGPTQTIEWFENQGVALKTEADGRMFPTTDDSATIVQCLTQTARRLGIEIRTKTRVETLLRKSGDDSKSSPDYALSGWQIQFSGGQTEPFFADKIIVASGSDTAMWARLATLGHRIVPPVPSLFTFNTHDVRLRELSGVSARQVSLKIEGSRLTSAGPLLVTHWGLSGPAVLRLSAWGARELAERDYRFSLTINFLGGMPLAEVTEKLAAEKLISGKKIIAAQAPRDWVSANVPLRLWQNLVAAADIPAERRWADLDKKTGQNLAAQLAEARFQIAGKSTFKEEFVTAGGVDLRDINFKTFESKICPGLFVVGEALDVDAITGGFNFQAAWTSGWIAGRSVFG